MPRMPLPSAALLAASLSLIPVLACGEAPAAASPPVSERIVLRELRRGVVIEDLVFKNSLDDWDVAYRVCPAARPGAKGKVAGILFVHWLDPSEPTSNRSQFLEEAVELARGGACGVLVDTMWSQPDWFANRDPEKDRQATERQLARIRSALDFLLATPRVDPSRVAFVGHDFGGMSGATLAGAERRVRAWALQAATPRWHEWYLLGRKLEGEARDRVAAATADLDPIAQVAKGEGSFLLQFATRDPYVPRAKAEEFVRAVPEPKEVRWYDAGHGLNPAAGRERVAWLERTLRLKPVP